MYCMPNEIQYTFRHVVYSVTIPDRRRAISIPANSPDTTIDRAWARLCGGAMSPTRGSSSCGVTVVMDATNDSAAKVSKLVVIQRASHCIHNPISASNPTTLRMS